MRLGHAARNNRCAEHAAIGRREDAPLSELGARIVEGSYVPVLWCGYTPGPADWTVINGYGPNWTHAVAQYRVYSNWPLVCTHDAGYTCNHIQFYVR